MERSPLYQEKQREEVKTLREWIGAKGNFHVAFYNLMHWMQDRAQESALEHVGYGILRGDQMIYTSITEEYIPRVEYWLRRGSTTEQLLGIKLPGGYFRTYLVQQTFFGEFLSLTTFAHIPMSIPRNRGFLVRIFGERPEHAYALIHTPSTQLPHLLDGVFDLWKEILQAEGEERARLIRVWAWWFAHASFCISGNGTMLDMFLDALGIEEKGWYIEALLTPSLDDWKN